MKPKKVAVIAVNPVNGVGLFTYLEAFLENHISYRTFAVADTPQIYTNSKTTIILDDVIANLKGNEDEYDALAFACGDAMVAFTDNTDQKNNLVMSEVMAAFAAKGKIMIGFCAGGVLFDVTGIAAGRKIAVHPYAKAGIMHAEATDNAFEIDGNFYTAQSENTLNELMPHVLEALQK